MNVHRSAFDESLITFGGILLGDVLEETGHDGLAHVIVVFAARNDVKFIAIHNLEELVAHVLSTFHTWVEKQ